jgi:hypothetical protein
MQSKLSSSCEMNVYSSGGITFLGSTDKVSRHDLMSLLHEIIRGVGATDIVRAPRVSIFVPSFTGQGETLMRVRKSPALSG